MVSRVRVRVRVRQVVSGRWLREGLLEGGRAGVAQPLAHVHEHVAAECREAFRSHGRLRWVGWG